MLVLNATLLVVDDVAGNATNATGTGTIRAIVERVVEALDEAAGPDALILALFASIPITLFVCLCAICCCGYLKRCCDWQLVCYHCRDCCCRRLCCRRPLAEQEEIARGPDQAIEEHQDEEAEVDSIDEPVRRTPPNTDGEEEDEDASSPGRACCTAVADAIATSHEKPDDATAPAAAPEPAPSAKAKGKRVVGKSVAFKND